MTISFEGLTAEQVRLPKERLIYELNSIELGKYAWVSKDCLWADFEGHVFIDGEFHQEEDPPDEISDEYVVIANVCGKFVLLAPHIPDLRVCVVTEPTQEMLASRIGIAGWITDRLGFDMFNANVIIPEYGEEAEVRIPVHYLE